MTTLHQPSPDTGDSSDSFQSQPLSLATHGTVTVVLPGRRVSPKGDPYAVCLIETPDGDRTTALIDHRNIKPKVHPQMEGLTFVLEQSPGGLKLRPFEQQPLATREELLRRVEAEMREEELADDSVSEPEVTNTAPVQTYDQAVKAVETLLATAVELAERHGIPMMNTVWLPPAALS